MLSLKNKPKFMCDTGDDKRYVKALCVECKIAKILLWISNIKIKGNS